MFTNKVWGLDYSPRKLLSLCCGFLSRSQQNDSSKDDEDEGKAVNGQGPGKAKDDSYDQIPGVNDSANVKSPDSTYGTTENADKPAANDSSWGSIKDGMNVGWGFRKRGLSGFELNLAAPVLVERPSFSHLDSPTYEEQ
ncbi:hypothetical protein BaRGS_00021660 [Batillaria attramentaria]|uniref:Uncharacterized protein n=1 Tax=Batillaria attramentaria TaxID=370345 RepID=A0ABD0KK65_9CAEN